MKGILLVNKEINKTSRDMVNELCHIFGTKKIGHTGTLDPIATGVLVMCIGKYTKLVDKLSSLEKEYVAEIKLGIKTDTLDITGTVLEERKCSVSRSEVLEVLNSLVGEFVQTIPIYSAKKINGKKLYEYARNGEKIELPKNTVNIFELELLDINCDVIKFRALVSKGTYIRSLIDEICSRLGVIGTMKSLVRTKQGGFGIENAYTLEQIKNNNYGIDFIKDILNYPEYKLSDQEFFKVKNGNKMNIESDSEYILFTYKNEEIAIYHKDGDLYRVDEMLY